MSTSTETDWSGLLPSAVSARIIESAIQQSVVLRLATRQPMPTGVEQVPVVSVAPQAGWVSAGGRKPIARIVWSAETLKAEEIAAVCAIPDVYISDTAGSWNPEESTENELAKAVGKALDAAVLWGTDAPPSFPQGGIVGMAGGPATGPDALSAISNAMGELEGEGIVPDGIAGGPSIGAALRAAYIAAAALPGQAPANEIWGVPVAVAAPWPASPNAIVGGWQYLTIGIREDVNFTVSREGVLLDDQGNIVVSAFQDDMTLVRVYARFGVAIARPLAADGSEPSTPFVGATWDGSGASSMSAPASASTPVRTPRKAS
jgi:hypothetical protein